MELHEAMYTLRAMRRLKTDPVPEELIWKVLDAAIRAPSGGNRQPWNFIVVTDAEKKRKIGEWYLDGWSKMYGAGAAIECIGFHDFHAGHSLKDFFHGLQDFRFNFFRGSGAPV